MAMEKQALISMNVETYRLGKSLSPWAPCGREPSGRKYSIRGAAAVLWGWILTRSPIPIRWKSNRFHCRKKHKFPGSFP